jgi:hypothetical protein
VSSKICAECVERESRDCRLDPQIRMYVVMEQPEHGFMFLRQSLQACCATEAKRLVGPLPEGSRLFVQVGK